MDWEVWVVWITPNTIFILYVNTLICKEAALLDTSKGCVELLLDLFLRHTRPTLSFDHRIRDQADPVLIYDVVCYELRYGPVWIILVPIVQFVTVVMSTGGLDELGPSPVLGENGADVVPPGRLLHGVLAKHSSNAIRSKCRSIERIDTDELDNTSVDEGDL